jgi:LPS export ABC transporter protein LptC
MKIDASRLRQLIGFAILAVTSYAVYERYHSDERGYQYEPFTKGYSIEGVLIKNSDDEGKITSTIEAPSVIHYADSGLTVINQPVYRMHQAEGDWVFSSESGEINEAQTQLYFPEQVLLELDQPQTGSVRVETSQLKVDLEKQTGTTAQPLKVTQPGAVLSGVGSVIKFEQQEIEILENVYAEFET